MSVSSHPGETLREKVRGQVENLKTMNPKRVERRLNGRILCTLPLAVSLMGYFRPSHIAPESLRLGFVCSVAFLLVAFKLFGGKRGFLWGAWLWLLSFGEVIGGLSGLFIVLRLCGMLLGKLHPDGPEVFILIVASVLCFLGLSVHRHLQRIEMGER